jgi:hypothetical protein
MRLEGGKSNLREIHNFMTKVNMLRLQRNRLSPESKNFERFLLVERGIGEVMAEIDAYKDNIIRARRYFNDFQQLKATHLKKRNAAG